jgi:hypothetical protein
MRIFSLEGDSRSLQNRGCSRSPEKACSCMRVSERDTLSGATEQLPQRP